MTKLKLFKILNFDLLHSKFGIKLLILCNKSWPITSMMLLTIDFYVQSPGIIEKDFSESLPNWLHWSASVGCYLLLSCIKAVILINNLSPVSRRFVDQAGVFLQKLVNCRLNSSLEFIFARLPLLSFLYEVVDSLFKIISTLMRRLNNKLKVQDFDINSNCWLNYIPELLLSS